MENLRTRIPAELSDIAPSGEVDSFRIADKIAIGSAVTRRPGIFISLHFQQNASELIETIYTSVIQFRETTFLADDLTLALLKKS
jgi:serine phosphatase RsbU (regulator of sigma subunit)